MSLSNRLALPFIDAAQSQKHVTHNEALVALDALVHLSVKARNAAVPPASPADGDRYLIGVGATGIFAEMANMVAAFDDGGWALLSPRAGWRCYVENENAILVFDGTHWNDVGLSLDAVQNLSLLGLGTTADGSNPLSAKLNSTLFTAKSTGEGGTGDLRFTLNKSTAGNTVSQLYETNYSGRAETGLTGDDHFHVKVSPDGSAWKEAVNIDPASGVVSFPSGLAHNNPGFRNRLINGNFDVWQRGTSVAIASGSAAYIADRWRCVPYNTTASLTFAQIAAPSGFRGRYALNAQGTGVVASGAAVFSQRFEARMVWDLDGKACVVSFDCNASTSAGSLTGGWSLGANTAVDNGTFSNVIGSGSFTVPAGTGIATIKLTAAQTAGLKNGAELKIQFAQTSSAGNPNVSIGAVQFEADASGAGVANPFEFRPLQIELALCQRYFQTSYAVGTTPGTAATSDMILKTNSGAFWFSSILPTRMRASPTITFYDLSGNSGKVSYYTTSWQDNGAYTSAYCIGSALSLVGAIAGSYNVSFHYALNAEL